MRCPRCQSEDLKVVDSRNFRAVAIRRRRECNSCGHRFTTLEEVVRENIFVLKRNGTREPFDREKLTASLSAALHKRPVAREQVNIIMIDALAVLEQEYDNEIPSRAVAEQVMLRLKSLDPIAYVRYASAYLPFTEAEAAVKGGRR
jgi:transcriptional repressor NrdR